MLRKKKLMVSKKKINNSKLCGGFQEVNDELKCFNSKPCLLLICFSHIVGMSFNSFVMALVHTYTHKHRQKHLNFNIPGCHCFCCLISNLEAN